MFCSCQFAPFRARGELGSGLRVRRLPTGFTVIIDLAVAVAVKIKIATLAAARVLTFAVTLHAVIHALVAAIRAAAIFVPSCIVRAKFDSGVAATVMGGDGSA